LRTLPSLPGSLCAISDEGYVIVWDQSDHTLSLTCLNGNLISSVSLKDVHPELRTMLVTKDGYHVVVGSAARAGKVTVASFELPSLQSDHSWDLDASSDISQIKLAAENTCLVVSTIDGEITVMTDPSLAARSLERLLQAGWSSVL